MLTFILAVVLGSRKDLTEFHNILNPEPALMMNMRFKVCKKGNKLHFTNPSSTVKSHNQNKNLAIKEIGTSG